MINIVWPYIKRFSTFIRKLFKNDLDDCLNDLIKASSHLNLNIFFDVGAHEGKVSHKIYKRFKTASIYSFEPSPKSFKTLEILSKKKINIKTFPYALSSQEGEERLFVNEFSETNSFLYAKKVNPKIDKLTSNIDCIDVPTKTLDVFCTEQKINHIDFLKLDTQGSELKILKGSQSLLQEKAISAIYCEVEFLEIYDGQCLFDEVFQYLRQYNYNFYKFYNFNYLDNGQAAWADALFISQDILK